MNDQDKNRIIERYNERLKVHGSTIQALASGTEDRRNLRFQVLTDIGIKNGDSVLDLGCGFGDYYTFLQKNNLKEAHYTGIDINPNLIEEAKKLYPEVNFLTADIQTDSNLSQFDYIVSTSCFNLKLSQQGNYDFIENLLKRCYQLSEKGIAIDFLTSYVDFKGNSEEAFYYEPEKVFSIAKSISKRVTLRHDYPLFEFCIYLYPDFSGWQQIKK